MRFTDLNDNKWKNIPVLDTHMHLTDYTKLNYKYKKDTILH